MSQCMLTTKTFSSGTLSRRFYDEPSSLFPRDGNMTDFPQRLRQVRTARKITQTRVDELLGVSPRVIPGERAPRQNLALLSKSPASSMSVSTNKPEGTQAAAMSTSTIQSLAPSQQRRQHARSGNHCCRHLFGRLPTTGRCRTHSCSG
jgi:hypothetical protein